jgi:GNAT superfamily N-acetyltransferase
MGAKALHGRELTPVAIRPYRPADRPGVRTIYGQDEFARPRLMDRYPRMSENLADSMSYYTDVEPESSLVAVSQNRVVGALLGAVDTARCEEVYKRRIRPLLIRRCLGGAYGWPGWLLSLLRTEWAGRRTHYPDIDLKAYPAHLHIGVLPAWRQQGIGTALMQAYAEALRWRKVSGYHLYASSFHPLGVAFYRKLGLEVLGQFPWRLHTGEGWLSVTELVFGLRL